jgi:hypothetical protein
MCHKNDYYHDIAGGEFGVGYNARRRDETLDIRACLG